jgi:hypothetical protein
MNLNENILRIKSIMFEDINGLNISMIPTKELRRPNGSIGTQGFVSENLIKLVSYISSVMGFSLPEFDSLKDLIVYIRTKPEIVNLIFDYVKTDPIRMTILPDGTYIVNDGNHRANLLNLLNVEFLPSIVRN